MLNDLGPQEAGGLSVLVVEDEVLIALDLKMTLKENGHSVSGPVGTVEGALRLLEREQPDVAVLDVNLGDQLVIPVARCLRRLNVPYVLSSSYLTIDCEGSEILTEVENVGKPFEEERLLEALSRAVAAGVDGLLS